MFDDPFGGSVSYHEGYDIAQLCMNGHCSNSSFATSPEFNKKFCDRCGAKTITACPKCQASIHGHFYSPGVLDLTGYTVPAYCHDCGNPYPWTETHLEAAKQMADETETLSSDDKIVLKSSIDDLVRETPRTQLAVTRFKRIVPKAGKAVAEAFRQVLVDLVSEAVRKQLWG